MIDADNIFVVGFVRKEVLIWRRKYDTLWLELEIMPELQCRFVFAIPHYI
jgi:hypothetical protein